MALPSDNWSLATQILAAGRARLGAEGDVERTSLETPDALADALIDAGTRQLQAADMKAHHNRLPADSAGSRAQSVVERLHRDPEPRVAQLIRDRVRAEWLLAGEGRLPHHHLQQLAEEVVQLGLEGINWGAVKEPEVVAKQLLDSAARALLREEGSVHERGGDAEEVQSAADAFNPPIRRRPLADIVIRKVCQLAEEAAGGSSPLAPPLGAAAAAEA